VRDAAILAWLAAIATGSQLIAVVVMWRLQRRTLLEGWRRHELTPEERRARIEEESRIAAEATAEAVHTAQVAAFRNAVTDAVEERGRRG
jgi:hypothetical protein